MSGTKYTLERRNDIAWLTIRRRPPVPIPTSAADLIRELENHHVPVTDDTFADGWDAAVAHHKKDFAAFTAKHDAVMFRLHEDYDTAMETIEQLRAALEWIASHPRGCSDYDAAEQMQANANNVLNALAAAQRDGAKGSAE